MDLHLKVLQLLVFQLQLRIENLVLQLLIGLSSDKVVLYDEEEAKDACYQQHQNKDKDKVFRHGRHHMDVKLQKEKQ